LTEIPKLIGISHVFYCVVAAITGIWELLVFNQL